MVCCPFITRAHRGLTELAAQIFSPPRPTSLHACPKLIMATPLIQCRGCKRAFTQRGLTLHLSKSRDIRCHRISVTLRNPVISPSMSHVVSPPPLDPRLASGSVSHGARLDTGGSRDDSGASGINGDLDTSGIDGDFNMQSPDGVSATTCVVRQ